MPAIQSKFEHVNLVIIRPLIEHVSRVTCQAIEHVGLVIDDDFLLLLLFLTSLPSISPFTSPWFLDNNSLKISQSHERDCIHTFKSFYRVTQKRMRL